MAMWHFSDKIGKNLISIYYILMNYPLKLDNKEYQEYKARKKSILFLVSARVISNPAHHDVFIFKIKVPASFSGRNMVQLFI